MITILHAYHLSRLHRLEGLSRFTLETIEHRLLIYKAIVEKHCPRILNSEREQRNIY